MIEVKVTLCRPDGEVLDSFIAMSEAVEWGNIVHPQVAMAGGIREIIEDNYEVREA